MSSLIIVTQQVEKYNIHFDKDKQISANIKLYSFWIKNVSRAKKRGHGLSNGMRRSRRLRLNSVRARPLGGALHGLASKAHRALNGLLRSLSGVPEPLKIAAERQFYKPAICRLLKPPLGEKSLAVATAHGRDPACGRQA